MSLSRVKQMKKVAYLKYLKSYKYKTHIKKNGAYIGHKFNLSTSCGHKAEITACIFIILLFYFFCGTVVTAKNNLQMTTLGQLYFHDNEHHKTGEMHLEHSL